MDKIKEIFGWQFLNEPVTRWWIFFGVLVLIAASWKIILEHMKA